MLINSPIVLARLAGLTYLILIVSGIFGIAHVPASLIQWDDAGATIANIKHSEFLFKIAIVSRVVCFVSFVILPILLYKLLGRASVTAGFFMVVFALISVPISLMSAVYIINVLHVIGDSSYLHKMPMDAIELQVMLALAASNNCATITNIFAGLWLFPFGYLVVKSGLLPKLLGYLLMLGCLAYLYEFIAGFLLNVASIPWYITLAGNLGVFLIALWLLVFGVRKQKRYESI